MCRNWWKRGLPKKKLDSEDLCHRESYLLCMILRQEIDYIPPEYCDIQGLLDELIEYVNTTDDHPLIVAAVVHYQLVTIHPFEDGNGRTARLLSCYIMDLNGYGFNGIGSLESILHTILMNIMNPSKWDFLHYIILEGRIRRIQRFGLITFCVWLNFIPAKFVIYS